MYYKDYSKETKAAMRKVEKYLIDRYGKIQSQWEITLMLMADNMDLLQECKESVKKNGIYSSVRGVKNPLISTIKDINATLLKLSQQLGITPWSDSKIKNDSGDDTDDFIDILTSGDDE